MTNSTAFSTLNSTTFTTPNPISATVEVAGARVRVTAGDRTDTRVSVDPIDPNSRRDLRVAERTKVEFTDGQLKVKTKVSGDKAGSVAITIDLPTASDLTAYLAHSQIQAAGSLGSCELQVASGQAQLDHVGALQASLSTGELVVGRIDGRATIDGAAPEVRIDAAYGPVDLTTSGGQVWIGHATSDLELGSSTCDFDIDVADGNVTATTAGGAIRIGRMSGGQAKLMNGSGNIELGISEGVAVSVDAKSYLGAVHNFLPSAGEPDPAAPKVMAFARTRHGQIVIHRATR